MTLPLRFLTCLLACLALVAPAQGVCAKQADEAVLRIVATTFPVHLITRNICQGRDYVRLELLVPASSGCPHDYSLTPADLEKLARAQAVVINGLGMEPFLDKAMRSAHSTAVCIDASTGIAPLPDGNPHTFSSPRLAVQMAYAIATALARLDLRGAAAYHRNAEAYAAKLHSLDRRLTALGGTGRKVALLQDSLAHFARNAGLEVVATIQDDEDAPPSAAHLVAMKKLLLQQRPVLILCDAAHSDAIAQTLSRETGIPSLALDMLSTGPENAAQSHYEAVMAANCNKIGPYLAQH